MDIWLEYVEGIHTAQWKQGSFLGMGGDRAQSYLKCVYRLDNGGRLPVFVQVREGWGRGVGGAGKGVGLKCVCRLDNGGRLPSVHAGERGWSRVGCSGAGQPVGWGGCNVGGVWWGTVECVYRLDNGVHTDERKGEGDTGLAGSGQRSRVKGTLQGPNLSHT